MGLIELYRDYNIQHWTEGKNCREGWVNVRCPYCGDSSNHLGADLDTWGFNCWKCGKHPRVETLMKILQLNEQTVKGLIKQYGNSIGSFTYSPSKAVKVQINPFKYPSNTGPLNKLHLTYLESRNFDPTLLVETWGLKGTGPFSTLKEGQKVIDFKHRIIIPIRWDGQDVSFQSRDATKKSNLRYITCPISREIVHHKDIIYCDQTKITDVGICVEGVTDVWRLGTNAFATFGIAFTSRQIRCIAKMFKKVFVMFDTGDTEKGQMKTLADELNFRGIDTEIISIDNDPASMSQKNADSLVKQLIKQ